MKRILGLGVIFACTVSLASCAQQTNAPREENVPPETAETQTMGPLESLTVGIRETCPSLREYPDASLLKLLRAACETYEINGTEGYNFDEITTAITDSMTETLGMSTLEGEDFLGFTYEYCPDTMEPFFYN